MCMKINENLKDLLNEEESKKTKYGCVMLFFKETDEIADLKSKIDDDNVYHKNDDNGDEDYGIDREPHVTILYGLLEEVTDEDVKGVLWSEDVPELSVGKISLFENDFDVVKFDIESDGLNSLNKKLSEFPFETDYPDYHPHSTICYAIKGKGADVIEGLGGEAVKVDFKS